MTDEDADLIDLHSAKSQFITVRRDAKKNNNRWKSRCIGNLANLLGMRVITTPFKYTLAEEGVS